jgi:hypothetical protein
VVIMAEAYTHSTWRVKPGLEDEFVRRWEDLAHWSALQGLTSRAKLLRDIDEPSRFVSFGPWLARTRDGLLTIVLPGATIGEWSEQCTTVAGGRPTRGSTGASTSSPIGSY